MVTSYMSMEAIISANHRHAVDEFGSKQRHKWSRAAGTWYSAEPPAVPSSNDIDNFMAALDSRNKIPELVGILGCTPSLRKSASDEIASVNGRVIAVDF